MEKYFQYIPKEYRNMFAIVDTKGAINYSTRLKISIVAFKLLEEYITKIWKVRGVIYE